MVQMADNLSSRANLGRLSISECLSTCILRVTPVARESSWAASGYRSCGLERDREVGNSTKWTFEAPEGALKDSKSCQSANY